MAGKKVKIDESDDEVPMLENKRIEWIDYTKAFAC